MVRRGDERNAHPERPWQIYTFILPGLLFERWAFKSAINLTMMRPPPADAPTWTPSPALVEYVFGRGPLPAPAGMTFVPAAVNSEVAGFGGRRIWAGGMWGPEGEKAAPVGVTIQFPAGLHVWVLWGESPEGRITRLGGSPKDHLIPQLRWLNYDRGLRLAFDWSPTAKLGTCPKVKYALGRHARPRKK
jgi:hypothetical protein